MKHIKYFISCFIFVLISCKSDAPTEKNMINDIIEDNYLNIEIDTINTENQDEIISKKTSNYLNKIIIENKLQEYYDLLLLKNKFPEIEEEVDKQLKNIGSFQDSIPKDIKKIQINIISITPIKNNKHQYIVNYEKNKELDTIIVEVTKTVLAINKNTSVNYDTFFKKKAVNNN